MKSASSLLKVLICVACSFAHTAYAQTVRSTEEIVQLLHTRLDFEIQEIPLTQVTSQLGDRLGVPFLWNENELDHSMAVGNPEVTFEFRGMSAHSGLSLLLARHELGYLIKDGYLLVAPLDALESELTIVIYDVTRLVKGEPDFHEPSIAQIKYELNFQPHPADNLRDLIQDTIAVDAWSDVGGPGSIESYSTNGRYFFTIAQSADVHYEVSKLLKKLESLSDIDDVSEELSDGTEMEDNVCVRLFSINHRAEISTAECARLVDSGFRISEANDSHRWVIHFGNWLIVSDTPRVQFEIHQLLQILDALRPRPWPSFGIPKSLAF